MHPYHGQVYPGPINDHFFKQTSKGEYPQHVTIVPVTAGDRVVAMLMGTCSKQQGQAQILGRLELQARTFSDSLLAIMAPKRQIS